MHKAYSFKKESEIFALYENPDGFLGRYAYSNEEKIGSQRSSMVITLYLETCYVASMVSSGGVVVITPDQRPGDVGSSPSRGIQPIFSEEYVKREKRKTDTNTFICSFPFIATLFCVSSFRKQKI